MPLLLLLLLPLAHSFELISHKGVHHEECLVAQKLCRADCLYWWPHEYMENTIPAIRKAFELGADRVEIDLRFSADGEVIVYHDRDLGCRTEKNAFVSELTTEEIKQLDLGHKLQFINRPGYLLRGKGKGLIPTLPEVLRAFPGRKFFLNPKETSSRFLARLVDILHDHAYVKKTHNISDFSMWGPWVTWSTLKERFPEFGERFAHAFLGNSCERYYQMYGWTGYFPTQCQNLSMVYSIERIGTWNTWGWPSQLLERFHRNGSKVFMIHVKDKDDLIRLRAMGFDGVITSRMSIAE